MLANLTYLQLGSLLALTITFSFIVANLLSNKKLSFIVMLLFIVMAFFIAIKYIAPNQYNKIVGNIQRIDEYLLIANGVIALMSILYYVRYTKLRYRRNLLIYHGINYTDNNFISYLSKKNKLVLISKKLEVISKKIYEMDNQLKLKTILVDGEEVGIKNFERAITTCRGNVENPTNYKFIYANGIIEEMNLIRKPVQKNNKVLGYVLLDTTNRSLAKVTTSEFKKNLFIYLDMLNQPLAYYDDDEKVFVVTRNLAEFLSIKSNRLSLADFKKLVHNEDYELVNEPKLENNKIKNIYIRLQTKVGYVWFEQLSASFNNYDFIILRKAELSKLTNINFGAYESLVNSVTHLCEDNKQFGLVMIHLVDMPNIIAEYGKEVADILTNKFLSHILTNILNNQVPIFKIGSIEYILLIDKTAYLDLIVRDLANKTSDLLVQDIIVNKYNIKVNSEIAVVYSKDVKKLDASTILKITFDTLKEANDPQFNKPYSIYLPKDETDNDFSLEALGINLDNDLSEYK